MVQNSVDLPRQHLIDFYDDLTQPLSGFCRRFAQRRDEAGLAEQTLQQG